MGSKTGHFAAFDADLGAPNCMLYVGEDSILEVWGLKTALTDYARAILLI